MSEEQTRYASHVAVREIAPESSVNVRRSDIQANRDRLKASIERYGFLPEHPILLRPHPQADQAQFAYEIVAGRSRFLAARDLGHTAVPAVVEDLEDEAAHLRSFNENDKRGDLTSSDKTYWYERKHDELKKSHGRAAALELTAEYYGTTPQTVKNYLAMSLLPDSILEDVDRDIINLRVARAIAQRPWQSAGSEDERDAMMIAAADWYKSLPNEERQDAAAAIKSAPPTAASAADFQQELERRRDTGSHAYQVQLPNSMIAHLERYARAHGYTDPSQVIPAIISRALADESAG